MLNQIGKQVKKYQHEAFLFAGHYGVEKESQRVDGYGTLSQTPLPFAQPHRYLKNDFAQAQAEVVTDYFGTCQQTFRQLQGLDAVLLRHLPANELLWPLSMPPVLPATAAIKMAAPTPEALQYRQGIAEKYGYTMQMMSAVHINFSLSERLLRFLFEQHYHDQFADNYIDFHNALYMKLAQNFFRYRYVLTYLFGASPLAEANFSTDLPAHLVRSLHSSNRYGYVNHGRQSVSFQSLKAYVHDLKQLVTSGELQEAREFYSPVRLHGASLDELAPKGIHYLELRTFDLDPYAADGLSKTDLNFLHLFLAYLLVAPSIDPAQVTTILAQAATTNETVALESPLVASELQPELNDFMQNLQQFAQTFAAPADLQQALNVMQGRVADHRLTPSYQLSQVIKAGSLQQFALQQAQTFKQQALAQPYQLPGYQYLDTTSQLIMATAYQRGLAVQILDPAASLLQLAGHTLISQGSGTHLNSQAAVAVSQNKLASKKLLGQAGIGVPAGAEYQTTAAALADLNDLAKQGGLVIKPKVSTQGRGVTVFQTLPTAAQFTAAIKHALATGTSALVENYVPGTVYRFVVIAGRVQAIAECTPANVVGDGRQTVAALVAQKNQQANRGVNLPLHAISMNAQTDADLQQGLSRTTIPARGNQVYLRLAANFATGGDSIDVTNEMDASYQQLALTAAQALDLQVAGVDIIIDNLYQPLDAEHPELAVVLGVTAQPDLAVHAAPYFGQAQPVISRLIDQLVPEK
ncbi:bifunctional glutamate--cysteine ligase GshA/glutathione synthetase GshB [Loigolactobacillus jiayinensis]|uniref:glutamate--cysteine ligase n=1 Tax=Loigolactobacillus jiayinensis TaxID=2486016 RepID=A0ABW1RG57_9LACO|nr:bifunctional glutamate--cysteine ligase GshA/glutathione synthetase GshB [Loigolactobacillus jiayinensis]